VDIRWTVLNQGRGVAAGPWSEAVFLGHDASASTAQPFGAYLSTENLNPGASTVHTRSVILPAAFTGNYYAIVRVDSLQQVEEPLAKGNNTTAPANSFGMLAADFVVTAVTVVPGTQFGQPAQVTWTVKNQGGAPALAHWSDGLSLSPTAVSGGI